MDRRAHVARALGHRHGDVRRGDMAVIGVIYPALDVRALVQQRVQLLDLGRGQNMRLQAHRLGDADVAEELVHPLAGIGDAQLAADVQSDRGSGFPFDRLVDVDRLLRHAPEVMRPRIAHQKARRVPGRARRQLRALQHHHIIAAMLGQRMDDRGADAASADNDDSSV